MKIYDCFMFSDEKMLLDIRLNSLKNFVDRFVIAEANYFHNGAPKKLNFDINDFPKFRDKIKYIVVDKQPENIFLENKKDSFEKKEEKKILNSIMRDNFQREQLSHGLENIEMNDWIIINDLDEIPNLENLDFNKFNDEILIFKQKMFYYKFNLNYENFIWYGSKAVQKKSFISPQWLRDIKNKKYSSWRIDTFFSKNKKRNIKFIENGGWHFTCIKSPEEIHKKLLSFAHHQDYEDSKITLDQLKDKINKKKVLYDHSKDKSQKNKWLSNESLKKVNLETLPTFIINNKSKYKQWLD